MNTKSRHVIIRGVIFPKEDKEPFLRSGKSLLGAVEYDLEADKLRCHECGEWYGFLGKHVAAHGLESLEYKIKHGLRRGSSLLCLELRERNKQKGRKQYEKVAEAFCKQRTKARSTWEQPKDIKMELRNSNGSCPLQIVARIKDLACKLNHTPTVQDCREAGISLNDVSKRTLVELQKLAGLIPNKPGGWGINRIAKYSKAILIESLQNFYVLNRRMPRCADFLSGALPAQGSFAKYFGDLGTAYGEAGLAKVAEDQRRNDLQLRSKKMNEAQWGVKV